MRSIRALCASSRHRCGGDCWPRHCRTGGELADPFSPGGKPVRRRHRRRTCRPYRAGPGGPAARPAFHRGKPHRRRWHGRRHVVVRPPRRRDFAVSSSAMSTAVILHKSLPYDALRDLEPVALLVASRACWWRRPKRVSRPRRPGRRRQSQTRRAEIRFGRHRLRVVSRRRTVPPGRRLERPAHSFRGRSKRWPT